MTYEEVFYHKTNNKLEIYYHITLFSSAVVRVAPRGMELLVNCPT